MPPAPVLGGGGGGGEGLLGVSDCEMKFVPTVADVAGPPLLSFGCCVEDALGALPATPVVFP